jgi:WD40 repeat protein
MPTSPTDNPLARFGGYMNSLHFDPAPVVGNRTDLVGLSRDGSVMAVVGQYTVAYSQLVVSDIATRAVLGHVDISNAGQSVDVSDDGRTVVVLSVVRSPDPTDATLTVFDVPSGSARNLRLGATALLPDHGFAWSLVRLTPDGRTAVVLLTDGSATVWDLQSGTAVAGVPGGPYQFVDVLPDGSFAGLTYDGRANFVDLATGTSLGSTQFQFLVEVPEDGLVAFAPDRSRIVGAEFQGATYMWDAKTGDVLGDPAERPDNARWVRFVPTDPDLVAIGTLDGEVVLWDVTEDVEVSRIKVHGSGVRDMAISGNGRTMAVTADDTLVSLWGDVGGPAPLDRLVTSPGLELFPMSTVMASPDRRVIAVVGEGIHEIRQASSPETPGIVLHDPDPGAVWAFDQDGTRLLAQESMHRSPLVVYDTTTGAPIWTQPGYDPKAQAWGWSTLSPDGSVVAFEQNPMITLWDVNENRQVASVDLRSLGLDGGTITQLMFTDDGRYLDIPTSDGPARFSVPDLRLVTYVPAARSQTKAVRLPGGDISAMNGPGRVSRFDMGQGVIVATGRGADMTSMGALSLSPDGSLVAAGRFASHAVSLFDAETAQPIGSPIPADGGGEVVFADDQLRIGLGSSQLIGYSDADGELTAWNIDPDDWQALACHAAGRNLTRDEWNQYIGADQPYRATCPEWPAATG